MDKANKMFFASDARYNFAEWNIGAYLEFPKSNAVAEGMVFNIKFLIVINLILYLLILSQIQGAHRVLALNGPRPNCSTTEWIAGMKPFQFRESVCC